MQTSCYIAAPWRVLATGLIAISRVQDILLMNHGNRSQPIPSDTDQLTQISCTLNVPSVCMMQLRLHGLVSHTIALRGHFGMISDNLRIVY